MTFHDIPKWTPYLQAIWSFIPSLSPTASLPFGPSWPTSAQHPYHPVSSALPQPSNSTLQSPMLSLSPASLPFSLRCPASAQHPHPPCQSLTPFFSLASPPSSLACYPSAQHPHPPVSHTILQSTIPAVRSIMPSLSPASPPSMPVPDAFLQPSIPTLQSLMKCPPSAQASLPSSPYCPSSALYVRFKTPINKK